MKRVNDGTGVVDISGSDKERIHDDTTSNGADGRQQTGRTTTYQMGLAIGDARGGRV